MIKKRLTCWWRQMEIERIIKTDKVHHLGAINVSNFHSNPSNSCQGTLDWKKMIDRQTVQQTLLLTWLKDMFFYFSTNLVINDWSLDQTGVHLMPPVLIKRWGKAFLASCWCPNERCWVGAERGSIKNERHALRELTLMDDTEPSAPPTVHLVTEDRDHITLGSVTHSESVGSVRHCVVTDVIWEDYGW